MNDTIALERLAGSLHDAVPQIRWPDMDRSRQVIRGVIDEAGYKLVLGRRGQFGLLGCYGISNVEPVELMEVNSALSGPLRLVQRSPSSNPHVSATWPLSGAVEAQAQCLAPDIQRLVVGDTHLPRDADSIDPQLRRWIKDLASAQDHLADVPSNDGGCVFTIGGGPTSLQISCLQRQAHLVAVSTLAANWVANTRCERNTADAEGLTTSLDGLDQRLLEELPSPLVQFCHWQGNFRLNSRFPQYQASPPQARVQHEQQSAGGISFTPGIGHPIGCQCADCN